jgi:hypothetical protein
VAETMKYNPISRNFFRLRRVLVEELGFPRQAIRPSATFAEMVPREHRRRVWRRFHREKIDVDALEMNWSQVALIFALMIFSGLLTLFVLQYGWVCVPAAIIVVLATLIALRPWANDIDPCYTLGDAALRMTTIHECRKAGYQLTHNEVFMKVRVVLVEALNLTNTDVKPESKLADFIE